MVSYLGKVGPQNSLVTMVTCGWSDPWTGLPSLRAWGLGPHGTTSLSQVVVVVVDYVLSLLTT